MDIVQVNSVLAEPNGFKAAHVQDERWKDDRVWFSSSYRRVSTRLNARGDEDVSSRA